MSRYGRPSKLRIATPLVILLIIWLLSNPWIATYLNRPRSPSRPRLHPEKIADTLSDLDKQLSMHLNNMNLQNSPHQPSARQPTTSLNSITDRLMQDSSFFKNLNQFLPRRQLFCSEDTIVIIVAGHPKNKEKRTNIRETWKIKELNIIVLFIMGDSDGTISIPEIEDVGDIIRLDYVESYQLLTVKTLASFQFLNLLCQQTTTQPWLIHIDDDMSLSLPDLAEHFIQLQSNPHRIWCLDKSLIKSGKGAIPHRSGKYAISRADYAPDHFPVACAGTAFALNLLLIQQLLAAVPKTVPIKLEDVYTTGILREAAEIPWPMELRPRVVQRHEKT